MYDPNNTESSRDPAAWHNFFVASESRTVAGALGIKLVSVSETELVLRMPVTDASRQPMGLLHGGVSMVLAETAASMHSCWGVDLTKQHPVGIEINGSHVRAVREGHVLATARVVRKTRTLIVHSIEITHEETGNVVCVSRVTNLLRDN
jgi:1,4-dihydroxy-2-naphthoyl-CoA hydrolase